MDLLDAAGSVASPTDRRSHLTLRLQPRHLDERSWSTPMNQLIAAIATDVCRKGLAFGALLAIVAACAHSLTGVA